MNSRLTTAALAPLLAAAMAFASAQPVGPQRAEPGHQWAATWIAPPEPPWASDFVLPLGMPEALDNSTVRQFLRTSIGGERIRIVVA